MDIGEADSSVFRNRRICRAPGEYLRTGVAPIVFGTGGLLLLTFWIASLMTGVLAGVLSGACRVLF